MKTRIFAMLVLLIVALVSPARAEGAGATSAPAVDTRASSTKSASIPSKSSFGSRTDEQRYAAREKASPDAKNYRGGDVIVISVTLAVIILLGVIILILIL